MSRNVFIYGMSGSGKDTISNYLRNFCYNKIRIAGTIKQYVYETYGFKSQEEFEEAKRKIPEVRKAHNDFGKQYDYEGLVRSEYESTINRIHSIINKTALEFEIRYNMKDYPTCICDVRNKQEAEILLINGFFGIFLNRVGSEYRDIKHKTEQDMFMNGELNDLIHKYNNMCLIFNSGDINREDYPDILNNIYCKNPKVLCGITDGTSEKLLELVKSLKKVDFDIEQLKQNFVKEQIDKTLLK